MPANPAFLDDKLEALVRKCIVFPADGSETRIAHMIARTATLEDIAQVRSHSRCVDMTSTFGDDYRKTRVMAHRGTQDGVQSSYLIFYNLSLNLPKNLNIAHLLGATPTHLKTRKRLFWRGDVVAMKVQPESERIDFIVESLDADLVELQLVEEFFREKYETEALERLLYCEEGQWDSYVSKYCGPIWSLLGAPKSYWNSKAAEENFLHDLNELRSTIGRPPRPPKLYVKSYTEHAVTLHAAFKTAFRLDQKVTGPPKLPLDLERLIFETCALECPEFCIVLVLVARRVHMWIDPILIATVSLKDDFHCQRRDTPEHFLAKLTNGKSVEYYAQHVKNLAFHTFTSDNKLINRILAICTGVENLVLPGRCLDFFENPQAGHNLRRLAINLGTFFPQSGSRPNFYHPCFANITHLHLRDEYWSTYAGWETLASLTHLAFSCSGPREILLPFIQTLPTVRYVALGHYTTVEWHGYTVEWYGYTHARVKNSPGVIAAWGVRIVLFEVIPQHDWERGARGEGDFWDLVEQEVERRLEEKLVD